MPPAADPPALVPDGAPVSVLVDFDGTISLEDVTDHLLDVYGTDKDWRRRDAEYLRGETGTRELIEWDVEILDADEGTLRREASAQRLDETFADLVRVVRLHGAAIEVVSDGLGFYVDAALRRIGATDVPVATAVVRFGPVEPLGEPSGDEGGGHHGVPAAGHPAAGGGPRPATHPARAEFPYGHPHCFVCGTCKRRRVLAHRAAGNFVVFVGDGQSDRYGAHHADIVFAKRRLAEVCADDDRSFLPWDRLADVARWMEAAFADGRLPASRGGAPVEGRAAPVAGFICGPEAWGPDRTRPVATADGGSRRRATDESRT